MRVSFGDRKHEAFRAGDTIQLKRAGQGTGRLGSTEDMEAAQDCPVHWAAGAVWDDRFGPEIKIPDAL